MSGAPQTRVIMLALLADGPAAGVVAFPGRTGPVVLAVAVLAALTVVNGVQRGLRCQRSPLRRDAGGGAWHGPGRQLRHRGNETFNVSVTARYIRMSGTVRATQFGYSIFEFDVYGLTTPPVTGGNGVCPWVGSTAPVAQRVQQVLVKHVAAYDQEQYPRYG